MSEVITKAESWIKFNCPICHKLKLMVEMTNMNELNLELKYIGKNRYLSNKDNGQYVLVMCDLNEVFNLKTNPATKTMIFVDPLTNKESDFMAPPKNLFARSIGKPMTKTKDFTI